VVDEKEGDVSVNRSGRDIFLNFYAYKSKLLGGLTYLQQDLFIHAACQDPTITSMKETGSSKQSV